MQVNVKFLDNLRLEAQFDDFKITTDQPIRYKGDGTAPSPFDYFLASSALCAAYFVKIYCHARDIPTEDIRVTQQNIIDPENRYHQDFDINIELPASISKKDREGILRSMDRCTVKRVIQNAPKFSIKEKSILEGSSDNTLYKPSTEEGTLTNILGKDAPLEETITKMTSLLKELGVNIEIASWRNQVPHVWSVHIRDADSPMCFTNGKGSTKDSAFCSALGEYFERLSTNYFYSDFYLGSEISKGSFVHYPNEKWFKIANEQLFPEGLMDDYLLEVYNPQNELRPHHLYDTNSANTKRGICALPYIRQSDMEEVFIPVNLIGNLFVSNGMSAGNTIEEARVQCLSEIFERAIKNKIITQQITLPDVPKSTLEKYPHILEGIQSLEAAGFPIYIKDASLGGQFPVMCVTLMNPKTGGVFASFGAHPKFEVALERSLTELLQGRSFEGMNDVPAPSFNEYAICEHNNIVDHFIDSTGVISWKFFSSKPDYEFIHWDIKGTTRDEFDYLMNILNELEKEVYIADYNDLNIPACRIIVPNFSEIYPIDDLIWDNNNQAIEFRERVLNIHQLSNAQLAKLIEDLDESEIDNYMPISELIGIAFDDNSTWSQLTIAETKCLSYLKLRDFESAKEICEMLATFSDSTPERKRFYQVLNNTLDIELSEELEVSDYEESFKRMYGETLVNAALGSVDGSIHFYNLPPTDMNLAGIDKHLKLLESYKKLIKKRELT